jgi:HD superfamily phosphodiesterase
LTVPIHTRDNAAFMAVNKNNYESIIESQFPGLIAQVREVIQVSEKSYEGGEEPSESHLWEHTMHVASITYQIACAENQDPLIPSIAALFHDAGKFVGGKYHSADTIEEEESARIAERLLHHSGMRKADIRRVLTGLKALYSEKIRDNKISAIIHDADFLSKFGALGVAAFFTKSVLRGRTLRSSVLGYLSKELTYAACLPLNMRTNAGRKLAIKKAADSMQFFRSLLAELRSSGIADLRIRHIRILNPRSAGRFLDIQLAATTSCTKCRKRWHMTWMTEKGVKCTKLIVDWNCSQCGERLETSFCLPELT